MNEKTLDERVLFLERQLHSIRCILAAFTAMVSGYMGAEIKDALRLQEEEKDNNATQNMVKK